MEIAMAQISTTPDSQSLILELNKFGQAHDLTARRLMMANPVTRDFLTAWPPPPPPQPGALDSNCWIAPTPACLVDFALADSREVSFPSERNGILARAAPLLVLMDNGAGARASLRAIDDAGLVAASLVPLAEAMAARGETDAAMRLSAALPFPADRCRAFVELARFALDQNRIAKAGIALSAAADAGRSIEDDAAAAVCQAGQIAPIWRLAPERAARLAAAARARASLLPPGPTRMAALGAVATALVKIGMPVAGLEIMQPETGSPSSEPIIEAASVLFSKGADDLASAAVMRLTEPRFQAIAWASVAGRPGLSDNQANICLGHALRLIDQIDSDRSRDLARARIVIAYAARVHQVERGSVSVWIDPSIGIAAAITDPQARAVAFHVLAATLAGHDPAVATALDERARQTLRQVGQPLDEARLWIAVSRALKTIGDQAGLMVALSHAAAAAQPIAGPAVRAPLLLEMAELMIVPQPSGRVEP